MSTRDPAPSRACLDWPLRPLTGNPEVFMLSWRYAARSRQRRCAASMLAALLIVGLGACAGDSADTVQPELTASASQDAADPSAMGTVTCTPAPDPREQLST
ncbi:MAG: hypothetical protein WBG57_00015, partial [Ornithinimicrobium sp.]